LTELQISDREDTVAQNFNFTINSPKLGDFQPKFLVFVGRGFSDMENFSHRLKFRGGGTVAPFPFATTPLLVLMIMITMTLQMPQTVHYIALTRLARYSVTESSSCSGEMVVHYTMV